jgi:diguanylate cyclase (GGDEF)-like protein
MKELGKQAERLRLDKLVSYSVLDTPAEEPFDRITRLAKAILNMPVALISLIDRDRQWFKSSQGLNFCQTARDVSFCTHTIVGDTALVVPDALADPRFRGIPLVAEEPHVRSYIGVPLRTPEGHNIGALCVMDHVVRHVTPEQIAILQDLARLVMDELELRLVATTDSLTGVMSRRAFLEAAERDVARAHRHGHNLSCLLLDLDHFKRINDAHGHAAGDKALQVVTTLLKRDLRTEDYLGRIGGEEFVLMMPMTDVDQAFDVGDRLRERVMENRIAFGGRTINLTMSVGIAALCPGDRSVHDMLARADEALYAAKLGGRNRAVCHQGASQLAS